MKNNTKKNSIISKDGVSYLIPFILITSCFALWGFANGFLLRIFCHGIPRSYFYPSLFI